MNRWAASSTAWVDVTGKPTTLAGFGIDAEADTRYKTLEAIISPTLTNSWANIGGGYRNAGYFKDPMGIVTVFGNIQTGTLDVAAFTLPVGYRPIKDLNFPGSNITTLAANMVELAASGGLSPRGSKPCSFLFSFRAEQ